MKLFKLTLVAAITLIVASCGNSFGGYDEATCKALAEKLEKNEALTQDDYSQMIDQTVALTELLSKEAEKADKDGAEAKDKFVEEYGDQFGTLMGFALTLEMQKSNLDEANQKKLEEAKEKMNKIKSPAF